jgi:nucleoside-diphosphate-sugar epimerase
MIIGTGSIAKLLNDREGFVFFASGVSDSSCKSGIEFVRECSLIREYWPSEFSMFVYFSTISIFTTYTPYTQHKLECEHLIRQHFKNSTIIRIGNIWECTNPNTFINAYKRQPYEPRDEYKYMISKKQLNFITDNLPRTGKHEISIFGEALKVSECLKR